MTTVAPTAANASTSNSFTLKVHLLIVYQKEKKMYKNYYFFLKKKG